jgi:hypothetical protein
VSRVRRRAGDDLWVLPAREAQWSHDWRDSVSDEHMAIWMALRVLAQHAFEARDERMCGRVLAAQAIMGEAVQWTWEDCTKLLPLPVLTAEQHDLCSAHGPVAFATLRGEILRERARDVFVAGVRRRPARLLRAEARGLLFALRWLYRAGVLHERALTHAEQEPWRRFTGAPEGAHPNILGPLPPAAANLN